MDTRCEACGARLYGDAQWCSQCLAPARPGGVAAPPTGESALRAAKAAPAARYGSFAGQGAVAAPPAPPAPARPTPPSPPTAEPPVYSASAFAVLGTPAPSAPLAPASAPAVQVRDAGVFRTTFGVIGLGLVVQAVLLAVARGAHWEPAVAIRYGLWADLAFYGVVAALVLRRAQSVDFRPTWTDGDPTEGLIRGVVIGAGVALGVVMLGRLATGQITVDPRITSIMSERTAPRILGAILITCVCAPWVEELLFRGLALESLRPWGTKAAVFGSASLFALWHTGVVLAGWQFHLAPFLYYVAMGSAFGRLYLKRGLKASIGAHTAFNGMLVVVALTVMTGPSHILSNGTVTARVPASWQLVPPGQVAGGYDMAVSGPSGAGLLVMHRALPAGAQLDPDTQAAEVGQRLATAGITVQPGSTRTADYPMGHVLRISAKAKGHAAEIVMVQRGNTLWQTVLVAAGSGRAEKDFEGILQHLQLP